MIQRTAKERLLYLSETFRSVAVTGPRQSGKTTLCRAVFPDKPYVSLENPDVLEFATADPKGFLAQFNKKDGAVLDEIQKAPHLFSYLQQILDESKSKGLFILTGSNNFLLQENITQSLSGRIAYLQLLPLSLEELKEVRQVHNRYTWHIFHGGYPEVISEKIKPTDWYPNYISTYIERDVRQIKNINNLSLFTKFLRMCAGRTGQILNMTSLSNDCGIDQKTVASWLGILQGSYVIFLLKPYHNSFNKRITKTPQLYFYDTGVASSLMGIKSDDEIAIHAAKGALFENLIISELIKNKWNVGENDELYYWRDKTGNEVDIITENAGKIAAIELKAGETISSDFFKGLNFLSKLNAPLSEQKVVYGGNQIQKRSNGIIVKPWNNLYD